MVEDEEIFSVITSDNTIVNRGNRLIELANAHGGKDNVSVIIIE
jgi:protein phosphatase